MLWGESKIMTEELNCFCPSLQAVIFFLNLKHFNLLPQQIMVKKLIPVRKVAVLEKKIIMVFRVCESFSELGPSSSFHRIGVITPKCLKLYRSNPYLS